MTDESERFMPDVPDGPSELEQNNDDNTALKALEDTINLPTLPDIMPKHLPTLRDGFARGKLADLKSFGGKSLAENMDRVDGAIKKTKELSNVYNRNHSEWTRRHINLDHYDPWFNMRQISAEMSSRRAALDEAKYRHMKNEVKLRRLFKKLERYEELYNQSGRTGTVANLVNSELSEPFLVQDTKGEDTVSYMGVYDKRIKEIIPADIDELHIYELRIEISQLQEGILNGMSYIEGAMKEVLILEDLYDQLKQQINGFSEADYEDHNARAHLRQAIAQSLRDIRATGSIGKGDQRLLEQIGCNPVKVQSILREFVNSPDGEGADDISILRTKKFIEDTTDAILETGVVELKSEAFGFNSKPRQDYMYTDRIAHKPDQEDAPVSSKVSDPESNVRKFTMPSKMAKTDPSPTPPDEIDTSDGV